MSLTSMRFGGFTVRDTTSRAMMRFLRHRIAAGRKVAIGFANHHFVIACQALDCDRLGPDEFVLLNDGIGIQLAAMLRFGRGFGENMNGTDFVPRFLCGAAPSPYAVYLIGGGDHVMRRAVETIADFPQCRVVGFCDGFSLWNHERTVIEEIAALKPDILLVGLGNPKQERWIVDNWPALDAKVVIGVGALFEWMTGVRRRAPPLIRRAHLEWAYRLALEPRRLLHRYTIGGLRFITLVLSDLGSPRRDER